MRKHQGPSAGVTLIEGVVGFVIGSIVLVALWSVYSASERQRAMADATLQGVNATLYVTQSLEQDMARCYSDSRHPVVANPDGVPGLLLHVFDAERSDPPRGLVVTKPVLYRFVGDEFAIYRQEGDGAPHRFRGSFVQLHVDVEPPADYLDQPPYRAAVDVERLRAAGQVRYVVAAVPAEFENRARELWKPQDSTVVWGSLALRPLNERRHYHFCASNATTRAVTTEAELQS